MPIRNGIKILSYFIGSSYGGDSYERDFKDMYGSDAQYIDVESVTAVAKTINRKMLNQ